MRKMLALMFALVLMLNVMGVQSQAADTLIPISGTVLNDQLNFKLDNVSVVPVGDDGTPVLPISYNGTTYLPVRAVGYLLGLGIGYENTTRTVLITRTTTKAAPVAKQNAKSNQLFPISGAVLNQQLKFKLDNVSAVPVGDDGTPVLPISYNGTTYLPIRAIGYLLGLGINYDNPTKTVLITRSATNQGTGQAQATTQTQVWKLISTVFTDGSLSKKEHAAGSTDIYIHSIKYEGNPNDLTITVSNVDEDTGAMLAGISYVSTWSNPPEYLVPGEYPSMNYQLKTLLRKVWTKPQQQTIYMNQGAGVFFASNGVKYIVDDISGVFTAPTAVTKGSPTSSNRTIQVTNGYGFSTLFTYKWVD